MKTQEIRLKLLKNVFDRNFTSITWDILKFYKLRDILEFWLEGIVSGICWVWVVVIFMPEKKARKFHNTGKTPKNFIFIGV